MFQLKYSVSSRWYIDLLAKTDVSSCCKNVMLAVKTQRVRKYLLTSLQTQKGDI